LANSEQTVAVLLARRFLVPGEPPPSPLAMGVGGLHAVKTRQG